MPHNNATVPNNIAQHNVYCLDVFILYNIPLDHIVKFTQLILGTVIIHLLYVSVKLMVVLSLTSALHYC